MLTEAQITLVKDSWAQVVPISDKAAELFYGKLFELDPALRPLFKDDMSEQRKKLMATIGVAVSRLTDLDGLVPVLQDLGRRHVEYRVKPEHYETVGQALLWTLGQGLGDAFTAECEEAWTATYGLMSKTMIDAAEAVQV